MGTPARFREDREEPLTGRYDGYSPDEPEPLSPAQAFQLLEWCETWAVSPGELGISEADFDRMERDAEGAA